jgi:hypothetical protein
MYIIIDDRDIVAGGYATGFDREGVSSAGIEAAEFREWIGKISDADMHAVEAFVIGDCGERRSAVANDQGTVERAGAPHWHCADRSCIAFPHPGRRRTIS